MLTRLELGDGDVGDSRIRLVHLRQRRLVRMMERLDHGDGHERREDGRQRVVQMNDVDVGAQIANRPRSVHEIFSVRWRGRRAAIRTSRKPAHLAWQARLPVGVNDHLVTQPAESGRELRDEQLGSAIRRRRHRDERGSDDGNAHRRVKRGPTGNAEVKECPPTDRRPQRWRAIVALRRSSRKVSARRRWWVLTDKGP